MLTTQYSKSIEKTYNTRKRLHDTNNGINSWENTLKISHMYLKLRKK